MSNATCEVAGIFVDKRHIVHITVFSVLSVLFFLLFVGFALGLWMYWNRRREYAGSTLSLASSFCFSMLYCGLLGARYIWDSVTVFGPPPLLLSMTATDSSLLEALAVPLVHGSTVALVVTFLRLSMVRTRVQKVCRAVAWFLLVISALGSCAIVVFAVVSGETVTKFGFDLGSSLGIFVAVILAMHSGDSNRPLFNRTKAVLAFMVLREVVGVASAIAHIVEGPKVFSLFLASLLALGRDIFPGFVLLVGLWPRAHSLRRNMRNTREHAILGRVEAWLEKNWGALALFFFIYFSVAFVFGLGLQQTCFSPLGVFGWSALLARGSAKWLAWNTPVLLLTMMFGTLSALRRLSLNSIIPFSLNISVHNHFAWIFAVMTVIHIGGHVALVAGQMQQLLDFGVTWKMLLWPWVSGWIMVSFSAAALLSGAVYYYRPARRCTFPQFVWVHRLGYLVFLLLTVHGAAHVLGTPQAWIFMSFIFLLWLVELVVRRVSRSMGGSTMNWRIRSAGDKNTNFYWLDLCDMAPSYSAGQWVYLSCPHLSLMERHPFTIALVTQGDWLQLTETDAPPQALPQQQQELQQHLYHPALDWRPSDHELQCAANGAPLAESVPLSAALPSAPSALLEPLAGNSQRSLWKLEHVVADAQSAVLSQAEVDADPLESQESLQRGGGELYDLLADDLGGPVNRNGKVTVSFLIQLGSVRGEKAWTRRLLHGWRGWQQELQALSHYDSRVAASLTSGPASANFSLHADGPFSSAATNLLGPACTNAVFVGLGSGVTAPLGVLSHFLLHKPEAWTAFIFSSRDPTILVEVMQVLRNIVPQGGSLPRGGVFLHLSAGDDYEWPDARLLTALKEFVSGGAPIRQVRSVYSEWLVLARKAFGSAHVSSLLQVDPAHENDLPAYWDAAVMARLIELLQSSVRHSAFANPVSGLIVLRGRPVWDKLLMRLGVAAICGGSAIPLFSPSESQAKTSVNLPNLQQSEISRSFKRIHLLYTGGSEPLRSVRDWVDENNRQAISGVQRIQANVKALWELHDECWA